MKNVSQTFCKINGVQSSSIAESETLGEIFSQQDCINFSKLRQFRNRLTVVI